MKCIKQGHFLSRYFFPTLGIPHHIYCIQLSEKISNFQLIITWFLPCPSSDCAFVTDLIVFCSNGGKKKKWAAPIERLENKREKKEGRQHNRWPWQTSKQIWKAITQAPGPIDDRKIVIIIIAAEKNYGLLITVESNLFSYELLRSRWRNKINVPTVINYYYSLIFLGWGYKQSF